MSFLDALRGRWREFTGRRSADRDLDREVRFHLEMETAAGMRSGLSAEEARRQALIGFGGTERHKEAVRDERSLHATEELLRDLRYALRMLRRSPAFAGSAILILALGIGAATAVATVADHVLRRSLPYPDADRIVFLTEATDTGEPTLTSWPTYEDLRTRSRTVGPMAAFATSRNDPLLVGGEPVRGSTQVVSADFFTLFGVTPVAGRLIDPAENARGAAPVALVSERLWRTRLGARSPDASMGIVRQGVRYTIVGVLPAGFKVLDDADAWFPAGLAPVAVRGAGNYWVSGLLRGGIGVDSARRELGAISAQLKREHGDAMVSSSVFVTPLLDRMVTPVRQPLLVLTGAAAFVLVVTAASIAMMQLARASSRHREIGIRVSLGAGRLRILRQLVTEQVVLAMLGCAGGILVAAAAIGATRRWGAGIFPRLDEVRLDGTALLIAVSATAVAAVLFGLAPALRLLGPSSRSTAGTIRGAARPRRFSLLVGTQAGVAVLLLSGAVLLTTSLYRVFTADLGYDRHHLVSAGVPLTSARYNDMQERLATIGRIGASLAAIPGAGPVAMSSHLPDQRGGNRGPILVPPFGDPEAQSSWATIGAMRIVSPNYFDVMGIRLLRGRGFLATDDAATKHVVINRAMAEKLWPGADPVGRQLRALADQTGDTLTVVGVVADARDWRAADGSQQEIYLTFAQRPQYAWQVSAVFRTPSAEASLAEAGRRLRAIDPELVPQVRTLDDALRESVADRRFIGGVVLLFAVVVLVLTVTGVFGSVAYVVDRRRREMAIRLAMGSSRRDVWLLVQRGVLASALVGVAAGSLLALQTGGLLASLLYGVSPRSPLLLAAAGTLVTLAIGMAASIPALRAARIAPSVAMKGE